jgi:hypothetical protein
MMAQKVFQFQYAMKLAVLVLDGSCALVFTAAQH